MKTKEKPRGPLLGAHMSIAGGVGNAFLDGQKVRLRRDSDFHEVFAPVGVKAVEQGRNRTVPRNRKETGIASVVAHDSYLLNLGSPDPALRMRSVAAFIDEMERCEVLGVSHLIAHPGAHVGAGEVEGIKTIAKSFDEVHTACPASRSRSPWKSPPARVRTWAIASSRSAASWMQRKRMNGCAFVSIRSMPLPPARYPHEGSYERTFAEFDKAIGIELLAAFHLNDSKKELQSRSTATNILAKASSASSLSALMNDQRFWGLPMCLETPKGPDLKEDRENLTLLRKSYPAI